MATRSGAADSYYYEGQSQVQNPPQTYNQGNRYQGAPEPKYQQAPPNYGQNYQNPEGPSTSTGDGKQTFAQAFKLEKPKYNDLWAGILVSDSQETFWQIIDCPCLQLILTFFGFTAVSGLSLQGYAANKGLSGGGIYHTPNQFSLNTNTIVLFAFILAVAFVFSWLYFTMARAFTKQFIWYLI